MQKNLEAIVLFNPQTKHLYSDAGVFLKKLSCPKQPEWCGMTLHDEPHTKMCAFCDKKVTSVSHLTEIEVQHLLAKDPNACLMVDLEADNIRMVLKDV
jgi:hypothetical protein